MERVLKPCKNQFIFINVLSLTFLKMIRLSEHNSILTQISTPYQKSCHQQKFKAFQSQCLALIQQAK